MKEYEQTRTDENPAVVDERPSDTPLR